MKRPYEKDGTDRLNRKRFAIILVRPENPENIGLAARAMKNTGFEDLRLVGLRSLEPEASRTAIHCRSILDRSRFFPTLEEATEDRHFVLASTARFRKTFAVLPLAGAVETVLRFPLETRVGLVFGNERTGLSSKELGAANSVFFIPQASTQPSYNLASAVLLTLFGLFSRSAGEIIARETIPIPRKEQEDCIRLHPAQAREEGLHPSGEQGPRHGDGPGPVRENGFDGEGPALPPGSARPGGGLERKASPTYLKKARAGTWKLPYPAAGA